MKKLLLSLIVFTSQCLAMESPLKQYQVEGLNKPQITQADILPRIEALESDKRFKVIKVGESYAGRDIFRIHVGNGQTVVFMWSQMHGDEPTATPALFDLINRIQQDSQWYNSWKDEISLIMLPMLNPDGAERYSRQNLQGIDLNRDALQQQTPEGRILLAQAKQLKPDFGFNLHDQNRFYSAGQSSNTATISLLAPAFNVAKDINDSRKRAMQLIGVMKSVADQHIANHLGRYDDTYSERAFGDMYSSLGVSTILIESGAYPQDPNRQVARLMNLEMLSAAIDSISIKSYRKQTLKPYHSIPFNRRNHFRDVVIEDLTVADKHKYTIDVALNLNLPFGKRARISELGDLSPFTPFYTFDAQGWQYKAAKGFVVKKTMTLDNQQYLELLQQGYSYFIDPKRQLTITTKLPVLKLKQALPQGIPSLGRSATFTMHHVDGKRSVVVVNGLFIDLATGNVLNKLST